MKPLLRVIKKASAKLLSVISRSRKEEEAIRMNCVYVIHWYLFFVFWNDGNTLYERREMSKLPLCLEQLCHRFFYSFFLVIGFDGGSWFYFVVEERNKQRGRERREWNEQKKNWVLLDLRWKIRNVMLAWVNCKMVL